MSFIATLLGLALGGGRYFMFHNHDSPYFDLKEHNKSNAIEVYMIAHSHVDAGWEKPIDKYYNE